MSLLWLLWCAAVRADDAPAVGMKPGEVHPDFSLPRVGGGVGKLSDHRGKKVFLFHFASW